jgi:hypothetical protein
MSFWVSPLRRAAASATASTSASVSTSAEDEQYCRQRDEVWLSFSLFSLIIKFERAIDFLLDQRVRISTSVDLREYERRKRVTQHALLLTLCTSNHFDSLVQHSVLFVQKRYAVLLHRYFQSVSDAIERQRHLESAKSQSIDTVDSTTATSVSVALPTSPEISSSSLSSSCSYSLAAANVCGKGNAITDNYNMDFNRLADYVNILFGANQTLVSFLRCFLSVEQFEEALVPFPQPVVREVGIKIFRISEARMYELKCQLDVCLFGVLAQLKREEMYPTLRDILHSNAVPVKFIISITTKAWKYHKDPAVLLSKFHEILPDIYGLCLNVVYQWLMSMSVQDIQAMLNVVLKNFAAFNEQLPQLIGVLRQHIEPNRDGSGTSLQTGGLEPDFSSAAAFVESMAAMGFKTPTSTAASTASLAATSNKRVKKRKKATAEKTKKTSSEQDC